MTYDALCVVNAFILLQEGTYKKIKNIGQYHCIYEVVDAIVNNCIYCSFKKSNIFNIAHVV